MRLPKALQAMRDQPPPSVGIAGSALATRSYDSRGHLQSESFEVRGPLSRGFDVMQGAVELAFGLVYLVAMALIQLVTTIVSILFGLAIYGALTYGILTLAARWGPTALIVTMVVWAMLTVGTIREGGRS